MVLAFDADGPYDRFVTELLAGDLVEEPRLDPEGRFDASPLGTGAWFLGEEVHSPVSPRGDQTDRVAHQVEVLSKAVLGLGVSCARCHDHKFAPISAVDYHALAGFAISTAPRQMRFETDGANRAVAHEVRALERRLPPRAATSVARTTGPGSKASPVRVQGPSPPFSSSPVSKSSSRTSVTCSPMPCSARAVTRRGASPSMSKSMGIRVSSAKRTAAWAQTRGMRVDGRVAPLYSRGAECPRADRTRPLA